MNSRIVVGSWGKSPCPSERLCRWQCYTEDSSVRDRARNRQRTLVTLDNHLANGGSQTHSTWLRRNESIENGFSILRADTGTVTSTAIAVCSLATRSVRTIRARGPTSESLRQPIVDQIRNNLLQLTFVTETKRPLVLPIQFLISRRFREFRSRAHQHLETDFVQTPQLVLGQVCFSKQPAVFAEYCLGVHSPLPNALNNFAANYRQFLAALP